MSTIEPAGADALIVKLDARPDFTNVAAMPRGPERKAAAWEAITDTARASQAPALELVEQLRASGAVQGAYALESPNALVVTPAPGKRMSVSSAFQALDGVRAIYDNGHGGLVWSRQRGLVEEPAHDVGIGLDQIGETRVLDGPPAETPYGLGMIGAARAWERGATGAGLVYGSIDTGVDVTHEALASRYRGHGVDGSVTHDYNWFDPTGAAAPRDPDGHGTHTTGTVIGSGVGVAPEAQFVAARGITGSVDSTLRSLQWMLAPTRLDGSAPDPRRAPDVVGMSWWTGSAREDLFLESMQDLRAAGIVPVKSAGNQGPRSSSVTSPGHLPQVIATAAVNERGEAPRFSSRGPGTWPPAQPVPKPDLAAPGEDVVSAIPGNRYGAKSGTSMAQPHLSGAVLALLSKQPALDDAQLDAALRGGARDAGSPGFDAVYGAGIVDIPAALDIAERFASAPAR